jgi:hypothetical protein
LPSNITTSSSEKVIHSVICFVSNGKVIQLDHAEHVMQDSHAGHRNNVEDQQNEILPSPMRLRHFFTVNNASPSRSYICSSSTVTARERRPLGVRNWMTTMSVRERNTNQILPALDDLANRTTASRPDGIQ